MTGLLCCKLKSLEGWKGIEGEVKGLNENRGNTRMRDGGSDEK
jgi:hypothetical protein